MIQDHSMMNWGKAASLENPIVFMLPPQGWILNGPHCSLLVSPSTPGWVQGWEGRQGSGLTQL